MKTFQSAIYVVICLFLKCKVSGNYIIYLQVSNLNTSGSAGVNSMSLTGDIGSSSKTSINTFSNGSIDSNLLVAGQLSIIQNKFPYDYGYINLVSIENNGDNLILQSLNIFDVVRNLWSNMSFTHPFGNIMANSGIDILYPVTGRWSNWSNWSLCSVTCGNGTISRFRTCTKPIPLNGGPQCIGDNNQTELCTNKDCLMPVNGGWSDWLDWGSCSVTCGSGNLSRQRTCTNPTPANGGKTCNESKSQWRSCSVNPCPIDGGWSDWSDWGNCSVSCGNGTISRSRNCTNPIPVNGGAPCNDSYYDWTECIGDSCPDSNYVTMDLFNSTIDNVIKDISTLKNKLQDQKKHLRLLRRQLKVIIDWGSDIDSEISFLKFRIRRICRINLSNESDKESASLNYALKSNNVT